MQSELEQKLVVVSSAIYELGHRNVERIAGHDLSELLLKLAEGDSRIDSVIRVLSKALRLSALARAVVRERKLPLSMVAEEAGLPLETIRRFMHRYVNIALPHHVKVWDWLSRQSREFEEDVLSVKEVLEKEVEDEREA